MEDRWICIFKYIKIMNVFENIFFYFNYIAIYNKTIHFYLENKHFRNRIWVYEALFIFRYNDMINSNFI